MCNVFDLKKKCFISNLDLPNCDIVNPSTLGDGICQDENNIEGCFHDFGDCCLMTIGKGSNQLL